MKNHLRLCLVATACALAIAQPSWAAGNSTPAAASAPAAASDMTDAEVRKIDMEAGKVTLKHAEIKALDMPGMTMVFAVKDKRLLDKLKVGDKVKFRAINDAGKFTVTDLQPAP